MGETVPPRLRFGIAIQNWRVSAEDADTFYALFGTPEVLVEYLRGFGFRLPDYGEDDRVHVYATRPGSRMHHSMQQYACLADVAGSYPSHKLAAMEPYLDLFGRPPLPSKASFASLERHQVDPVYAAQLWKRGIRIRAILKLWASGVPLEFARELGNDVE